MLYYLLYLISVKITDSPITEYLNSDSPCNICQSLIGGIKELLLLETKTTEEIHFSVQNYCKHMNKYDRTMCNILVSDKLKYIINYINLTSFNICTNISFCSLHNKVVRNNRIRIPISKPRAILLGAQQDCNVCEMIVGYALEHHARFSGEDLNSALFDECAKLDQFKDHCVLFNQRNLKQMMDFALSTLHQTEICIFFGQC